MAKVKFDLQTPPNTVQNLCYTLEPLPIALYWAVKTIHFKITEPKNKKVTRHERETIWTKKTAKCWKQCC